MKELSKFELEKINGGWIPIVVGAAKLIAAGVAALAAAGAVAYGVGYYDGKQECEDVCASSQK